MQSVSGAGVAAWAGRPADADYIAQADAALPLVLATVKAYTRGRGFDEFGDVEDEVAAVVCAVTVRVLANPTQLQKTETTGPFAYTIAGWQGFTLLERAALDRWRVRAM